MKKIVLMFLTICVLWQAFAQTALTPKKRTVSPQFAKLVKYGLTNNNEPPFTWSDYGATCSIYLKNCDEGVFYNTSQGDLKTGPQIITKGTIVVGYSGDKILATYFIFDYAKDSFGLYSCENLFYRRFFYVDKSRFTLNSLIETLIEDQTDIKWIRDEL